LGTTMLLKIIPNFNIESKELCKMQENDIKKICCSDVCVEPLVVGDGVVVVLGR
jgi:hypothetical protein